MAKELVDIEKLLTWAYRDELPKQAVGGLTGWESSILLGTVVDDDSRPDYEARLPVSLGPPHPDALTLDYAVRSLPSVRVNWMRDRDRLLGPLAAYVGDRDPIARGMETSPGPLLQHHAIMRTRPSWDLGAPRLTRIIGPNGKPRVTGVTPKGRYVPGAGCPLRLDPPAPDIARARWEYRVWYDALVMMASGGWIGQDFAPQQPCAPAAPWIASEERNPRILWATSPANNRLTTPMEVA